MADYNYTPLGSFSRTRVKTLCSIDPVFSKLTDDQKNEAINFAIKELSTKLNELGKNDYYFDTIGDADKVLAPSAAANATAYADYIQIKFSGTSGTAITGTAVNLTLVSATYSAASGLAVYTVELSKTSGDSIDGDSIIHPGISGQASIEKVSGDIFTVTAEIGHDDFSVFVKNMKES